MEIGHFVLVRGCPEHENVFHGSVVHHLRVNCRGDKASEEKLLAQGIRILGTDWI